jgi:hypothetical protein
VKNHRKYSSTTGDFAPLVDGGAFGASICLIGDLDGNGVDDLAVGASSEDSGGPSYGAVHILFMATGGNVGDLAGAQVINSLQGGFMSELDDFDRFGASLGALGDLNDDGVLDIVVGAMWDDDGGTNTGAIYILFLNADGTVNSEQKISNSEGNFLTSFSQSGSIYSVLGDSDNFGASVAPIGDLDGDGVEDLAVGIPGYDEARAPPGFPFPVSIGNALGATGVVFLNSDGSVKGFRLINDVLGGHPDGDSPGLETQLGTESNFGTACAYLGDVDGDGDPDVAIGAGGHIVEVNGSPTSHVGSVIVLAGWETRYTD